MSTAREVLANVLDTLDDSDDTDAQAVRAIDGLRAAGFVVLPVADVQECLERAWQYYDMADGQVPDWFNRIEEAIRG